MRKDKAWLKEAVSRLSYTVTNAYGGEEYVGISKNVVLNLIHQLEEPEQEKVVVPQFVADYIKASKADNESLNQAFAFIDDKESKELWEWMFPTIVEGKRENQEVFTRAWLDGYTVEKEKLYKVELPIDRIYHILTVHGDNSGHFFGKEHINDSWYRTYLTEQEIKAIDERYLAFKEEVTE